MLYPVSHSGVPPWRLLGPEVDTFLLEFGRIEAGRLVFRQKLAEFRDFKETEIGICNSDFGESGKVAAVINGEVFTAGVPDGSAVFSTVSGLLGCAM